MVSGNAPRSGVVRIVIADNQTVHGQIHLSVLHPFCPAFHHIGNTGRVRLFPVNHHESFLLKELHPLPPGYDVILKMHQRKGMETHPSLLHLFRIVKAQRTGSQVAGIGIFFIVILNGIVNQGKIRIGNHCLPANHQMALILYFQRKSLYGIFQISDIGSGHPVSPGEDSGKLSSVIGEHQRKAVQLPGKPDLSFLRPFYQLGNLLCLCQGKRRKLMGLPLSVVLLIAGILGGAVRQRISRLCFQGKKLVEHGVPFIIGHNFFPAVIISLRGLVQPPHQLFASAFIIFHFFSPCPSPFSYYSPTIR